jgi:hypothetical protein
MSGIAVGTATLNGISGQASVQITSVVPSLNSITVTPANPTYIGSFFSLASTEAQFTATGNYSDGSTLDLTPFVQWSTSSSTVAYVDYDGVMRFNAQGLLGLVGLGQNTITIIATSGSVSGSTQVYLTVL